MLADGRPLPARRAAVDRRLLGGAVDLVHAPRAAESRRMLDAYPRVGAWYERVAGVRPRRVDADGERRGDRARGRARRSHAPTSVAAGAGLRRRRRGHRHAPPTTRTTRSPAALVGLDARRGRVARDDARAGTRPRPLPAHRLSRQGRQEGHSHEDIQGRHGRHHRRRLGLRPRDLAPRGAARHERRHGRRAAGRARPRRRRDRALGAEVLPFRLDVAHAAEVEALGAATKARFGAPQHRLQQRRRRRRRPDLGEHASPTGTGCSASTSWASPTASASSRR